MSERRVFLAIYWRSKEASARKNRAQFGTESFLWEILIGPKHDEGEVDWTWDVSDAWEVDGVLNPEHAFLPRTRSDACRRDDRLLIGLLQIGCIRDSTTTTTTYGSLHRILGALPLPDVRRYENCVTWTTGAINALKQAGHVPVSVSTENCFQEGLLLGDRAVETQSAIILRNKVTGFEEKKCCIVM